MQSTLPGRTGRFSLLAIAAAGLVSCATFQSESAFTVLQRANVAMGANALRSVTFSGSGSGATFGQAYRPGEAWPKISYSSFVRTADYANATFREDAVRTRAEPTGGGAIPLMGSGEQRTSGWLRGSSAWNMAGNTAIASPLALTGRTHDLWTTPHGVIKAALANHPSVRMRSDGGRKLAAVSFEVPGQFKATALINSAGMVEQIESVQPNPVMGDTRSTIRFSDYRYVGGIQFPMRIQQDMGEYPVLDLAVQEVRPNGVAGIEVPPAVPGFAERIVVDKVADGVWFLTGGSHNSVAIEMADHVIVVESPLYDDRAAPMLAQARALAGGKPIRFVINSHHHFDHAGGLRTAVAEGATLVTSELARPWFETVLGNPNRIAPDAMARSGRSAKVTGVSGRRSFTDGQRIVDVVEIQDSLHASGFLMVHLPRERLLIEADAYTPSAPNAAPAPTPNALTVNLVENIERLGLQIDQVLPLHGRRVPAADLYTAAGRKR